MIKEIHVDVLVQDDDRAILFSVGHRPDRCIRCMNALATFTDHEDPIRSNISMEKKGPR